jgi:HK97 family phage portal protein
MADTISTMPIDVYRTGQQKPIPTPPVLVEPAAGQPRHDWLYQVVVSAMLRGNATGITTARSGATLLPAQVELVHPDRVMVTATPSGAEYRIAGRSYAREDVWHFRAYPMPGILCGLSPIEYARQAIGLGIAAEKFGAQFFGEGAMPTGVLKLTGNPTPNQMKEIRDSWQRHQGNHRLPGVLLNGDYQQISVAPNESQFLETQRFTVSQIARIFGVPPEMVGGETGNSMTYANVESRALDFLRYSVQPWLVRLETALSALLPRNQYVKFNPDALLRSTTTERYAAHQVGIDAGFLTVNEVRAMEDLPPLAAPPPPPAEGTQVA